MPKLNLKSKLILPLEWFKRLRDYDTAKRSPRPYRDWRRLMIGWFVGLFAVIAVAGYVEWSISRDTSLVSSGTPTPSTPLLTEAQLKRAQAVVSERAARLTAVSQTAPVLIDPAQ